MKKSLLILVMLVITSFAFAQFTWFTTGFNHPGFVYALITANDGSIIAGENDKIYRSTDNGATWGSGPTASNLNESINCFAKKSSNGFLFAGCAKGAGTPTGGVYLSTDNGASWNAAGLQGTWISAMAVNSNGYIFAGSAGDSTGIRFSNNNGGSWTKLSNLQTYDIYSMTTDNNGNVYVGTGNDGAIFKLTNNGTAYTQIHYWGPTTTVRTVAISDSGILFAFIRSGMSLTGELDVSTNNGNTWTQQISNIDFYNSPPILIFSNQIAFLATYGQGVYQTLNAGSTWSQINSGLTNSYILSLTLDNCNYLYAGSNNINVFKSDICVSPPATPVISLVGGDLQSNATSGNQWYLNDTIITGATNQNYTPGQNGDYYVIVTINCCASDTSNIITVVDVGYKETIENNGIGIYPNPSHNNLCIKAPQKATIEISNVQGQLIKTQAANFNKTIVDISSLPIGIYMVVVKTDKGIAVRKFVKE